MTLENDEGKWLEKVGWGETGDLLVNVPRLRASERTGETHQIQSATASIAVAALGQSINRVLA